MIFFPAHPQWIVSCACVGCFLPSVRSVFYVSSWFISSLLTHHLTSSFRSLNWIRSSCPTARQRRSPLRPGLCRSAQTQNISCSLTMRWLPMGWAAGMQMVQESGGWWGRTALDRPGGRAPEWGQTTTEGRWSRWPHGTGTLRLTGWVRLTTVCMWIISGRLETDFMIITFCGTMGYLRSPETQNQLVNSAISWTKHIRTLSM